MKFLQELFHGKGYIDGITIINLEGEILFTAKFNDKFRKGGQAEELVGKTFWMSTRIWTRRPVPPSKRWSEVCRPISKISI